MIIDEELQEQIINFGAFQYSAKKMGRILGIAENDIHAELDKRTKFYNLYNKGLHLADYIIDLKLFDLAKIGDMKALQTFEARRGTL